MASNGVMVKAVIVLSGVLVLGASAGWAQPATPVAKLDLNQLTGAWYEIAHLPVKSEKHCVADGRLLYALGDKPGRFQMVSSCRMKDGYIDVRNNNGRVADKSGDGKMKVATLWPLSRKYWVLALGPENGWALVGTPNHKSMWILSRTEMKPETLNEVKAKASSEGYDLGKLIVVPGWHGTPLTPEIPVKSSND